MIPQDLQLTLTVPQYQLLRLIVQPTPVSDLTAGQLNLLPTLFDNRLARQGENLLTVTGNGLEYLTYHREENGRIVECERRLRITKTTIRKQYGLTERMVRDHLPKPMLVQNPVIHTGAPMKVWFTDEAESCRALLEDELAVRERFAEKHARTPHGVMKARTPAISDEQETENGGIHVVRIPFEQLREETSSEQQALLNLVFGGNPSEDDEPASTSAEGMVGYVLQHLADYDRKRFHKATLDWYADEGSIRYHDAVLDSIAGTYPELADECRLERIHQDLERNPV